MGKYEKIKKEHDKAVEQEKKCKRCEFGEKIVGNVIFCPFKGCIQEKI